MKVLGLEEEEDEESYRMIRKRERRQVYLHDYAEEYCSTTNYGDLIIQQRLEMVHWIVGVFTALLSNLHSLFPSSLTPTFWVVIFGQIVECISYKHVFFSSLYFTLFGNFLLYGVVLVSGFKQLDLAHVIRPWRLETVFCLLCMDCFTSPRTRNAQDLWTFCLSFNMFWWAFTLWC